jgi:D-beta-D-heptose 7-phosphate kinase/D-beta-D-heptose 1-phosphate adenosyltransferase
MGAAMTLSDSFSRIFEGLATARVMCLGDVMLDHFLYGEVSRISPEAPVPVFRVVRDNLMLGGAGNVARNLSALGSASTFVAAVGDDAAGAEVARLLSAEPSVTAHLHPLPGRRTTEKSRFVAGVQQLLRADREETDDLDPKAEQAILDTLAANFPGIGALALSDYGKGLLTPRVLAAGLALAAENGIPAIVDPKGRDYRRYRGAFLATPNRAELAEAVGHPVSGDEAIVEAAKQLMQDCGIRNLLVTRSQDGMTLVEEGGAVTHIAAEAREVFDVSGAGDTVVATLAAALAAGGGLLDAARLANLAGGIVVGKIGTATASAAEIRAAAQALTGGHANGKVLPRAAAAARVRAWQEQGLTVGFANGCFDLLHPGHVSLLRQARAACDKLVVGLNGDASVRRLKGETRPVQDETARALVLAAMEDVDAVTIFDEDTPFELISLLRPDLLVKGADYAGKTVVGADLVTQSGGRVVLATLEPGFSTTGTVRKLTQGRG